MPASLRSEYSLSAPRRLSKFPRINSHARRHVRYDGETNIETVDVVLRFWNFPGTGQKVHQKFER